MPVAAVAVVMYQVLRVQAHLDRVVQVEVVEEAPVLLPMAHQQPSILAAAAVRPVIPRPA
jgi:hypothetical protein